MIKLTNDEIAYILGENEPNIGQKWLKNTQKRRKIVKNRLNLLKYRQKMDGNA